MAGRDHDKSRSERGMILRLLVVDQAPYTLVKSLWSMLDRRGFSLTRRALFFHIEYLEKAKYVELRRVKEFPSLLDDDDTLSPGGALGFDLDRQGIAIDEPGLYRRRGDGVKKDRKVRFPAFERLSARAQALVIEGIEKDLTQVQIIAKVADEAGEEISSGSIGRFVENWRLQRESEQASDKQAKRIIEGIKAADIQGTEVGEMLIKHGLFENADQAGTLDLGDLLRHARQYEELKIRNRQLDQTDDKIRLLEREVGLREERLKEIRGKAQRIGNAVRAAEEKVRAGRQLDLDDFSGMRELYGFEALTEVPSAA